MSVLPPVPGASGLPVTLLARIEDAGLNASAPPQQRWLDGWLLRLSPAKAKRARCINALADGRLPFDERLVLAREVYRAAGLPLLVRITPFSRPTGLDDQLAAAGYATLDDTRVMVCPHIADAVAMTADAYARLTAIAPDDFAELVGGWRESPPAQRRFHAQRLRLSPALIHARVLHDADGRVVACGQFAVEGDLVGLYDVYTLPDARGRGHATTLCRALLAQAAAHGARVAYLQVDAVNAPARAIYRRLGFADAYAYHYRTDDPAAA